MKLLVLALVLAVAHAGVIFPEDAPQANQAGQCPSGYPNDGLFTQCALASGSGSSSASGWRVGSINGDWNLTRANSALITFPADFTSFPVGFDQSNDNSTSGGCSLRMPGYSAVFQVLTNLKYAHYQINACAKPLGQSRCKVVIMDTHNRIVDQIDFNDETALTCPTQGNNTNSDVTDCQNTCTDAWSNATFRYWGDQPSDIIVRRLGDTDMANWRTFPGLVAGDSFSITSSDFAAALPPNNNTGGGDNSSSGGNSTGSGSSDVLPAQLEFVSGKDGRFIDVISTDCSNGGSLFPGQYFGDNSQFLVEKAENSVGSLCAVSDFPGAKTCACEDENRKEICLVSKGFVALPEEEYMVGLSSEECSCAFDNICLSQVGGIRGYFGSPWLLARQQQQQPAQ